MMPLIANVKECDANKAKFIFCPLSHTSDNLLDKQLQTSNAKLFTFAAQL